LESVSHVTKEVLESLQSPTPEAIPVLEGDSGLAVVLGVTVAVSAGLGLG